MRLDGEEVPPADAPPEGEPAAATFSRGRVAPLTVCVAGGMGETKAALSSVASTGLNSNPASPPRLLISTPAELSTKIINNY